MYCMNRFRGKESSLRHGNEPTLSMVDSNPLKETPCVHMDEDFPPNYLGVRHEDQEIGNMQQKLPQKGT